MLNSEEKEQVVVPEVSLLKAAIHVRGVIDGSVSNNPASDKCSSLSNYGERQPTHVDVRQRNLRITRGLRRV